MRGSSASRSSGEDEKRLPDMIEQWFGDSIGWWEGDTLVVETRNPHRLQARGRVPLSKEGKIIERFKRVSDLEIDYTYEVIDPISYTQTWTGQMPLRFSNEQVYEYACHEGNYALPGILVGMTKDATRRSKRRASSEHGKVCTVFDPVGDGCRLGRSRDGASRRPLQPPELRGRLDQRFFDPA